MKSTTLKKIVVIAGALLICGAMLAAYFLAVVPPKHKGVKTVTLQILYSDKTFVYERLETEKETVCQLMEEYDEKYSLGFRYETSVYGAFVTEIKGTENDAENGCYYMFKVNGVYSNFACDQTPISDGDVVIFEYGVSSYDPETFVTTGVALAPSDSSENGKKATYGSGKRIAVIVVCSVIVAAAAGGILFVLLKKDKAEKEN